MDAVYEVLTSPRDATGLGGITFRFMPDARQVAAALELYAAAGVPTRQFVGVPVFQAEGLTVTASDAQYVPLFLAREDLDVAVSSAHRARNAGQIRGYRERAAEAEAAAAAAAAAAKAAPAGRRPALEAEAEGARERARGALDKAAAVERAPLPKVEVGSLEEVLLRMSTSRGSELAAWSQCMFVAPGLLQNGGGKKGAQATLTGIRSTPEKPAAGGKKK